MAKPLRAERPSPHGPALEEAALALQRQQPEAAERLAGAVLRADRGNLVAAQILGTALLQLDRAAEAVEALRRAARRSEQPAIETLLARALAAVGEREAAFEQLRLAVGRRPAYALAFLDLGVGLGEAGRCAEGIAVLESGLALAPDADGLRVALGHLHLRRANCAAAREAFARVHAAAPGRHDAMIGLARVLALQGEHAAAAELYRRALALRPDDPLTRIALGKCLLELGQRDEGEAAIRAAGRGSDALAGLALTALAATPHGRVFLRPSAAARFLRGEG
ncbi:tetratricopeptide repeat protein [Caulobacter sp. KR2-114]|uniref:tetratricopeptide repeat protein n=1 Tax=Caulobacter sp. KR2-114 TaxID=3400912 RepID=UPI003C029B4A